MGVLIVFIPLIIWFIGIIGGNKELAKTGLKAFWGFLAGGIYFWIKSM